MKENEFKVGDWVISTSWINQEPRQITKIEFATTPDEEHFVFLGDNYCIELEYIENGYQKKVITVGFIKRILKILYLLNLLG